MWVDSFLGQTEQGAGSCNKMKSLKLQSASCSEQRERWGALTQPSSCFVTCTGDPCPPVPLISWFPPWGPGEDPPVSGLGLSWEPHCCWWCFGHVRFDLQDGCPRGCAQVPRGPQTQWGRGGSRSCAHSVPPTLLFLGPFQLRQSLEPNIPPSSSREPLGGG